MCQKLERPDLKEQVRESEGFVVEGSVKPQVGEA